MKLLLGGSLAFSILHSILLWNQEPGIAVVIFCVSLLTYFIYFLKKQGQIKHQQGLIFSVPIILLSLTYFVFHNYFFQTMNFFVICALWLILIICTTQTEWEWKSFMTKTFNLIIGPFEYFQSIFEEIKKLFFKKETNSQKTEMMKKTIKAFVFVIPIVLVVLFLLGSADYIFAGLFTGISDTMEKIFDSEELPYFIARLMVIGIIFLYMSSFLYNIIKENSIYHTEKPIHTKEIKIEQVTIQLLLTVLNIIYLVFCTIQILYLFSGDNQRN